MSVLVILEWILEANNIITATVLLTFVFALIFLVIRGKRN